MRRFALALLASTALTGTAFGADIARTAPVASQPVAYGVNWTGIYIGGHIGGAWTSNGNNNNYYNNYYYDNNNDDSSFIGGGQIGFNYQIGSWVLGVEGDISAADLGNKRDNYYNLPYYYGGRSIDWFATLTGRVGYAWDNWLLYVKGGGAWADTDNGRDYYYTNYGYNRDNTLSGWTVGVGVEWAWTPNWSVKLEYDYLDFESDKDHYYYTNYYHDRNVEVHAVKLGINYRFGGPTAVAPVAARY
jgi:outer membrane immunogenic protein